MISGQQTLASIDGALDQARAKAADIEAQLDAANAKVAEMQLAQAQDYRELARLRVDLVADGALIQHLDQAEAQVAKLLEQRKAALADLERQIQAAREARAPLEAERAERAAEVEAAAAQVDAARGQDPGPPGCRSRLSGPAHPGPGGRAHRPPRRGEGQLERGGTLPEGRLLPGRRPLHVPLGAPLRAARVTRPAGLVRWLDGMVAQHIGFADARTNYNRLNEIPQRLREHAQAQEAAAAAELTSLRALETQAQKADGIPKLEEAQAQAQGALDAVDARLAQADADAQALAGRKAGYASGEDDHTRSAVDYLAGELARDDLMQLRREAMLTPFPEDDTVVARMLAREDERRTLEASLQGLRQAQNAARMRAAEVDALRQDFKRNRYDRAGSTFGDDALVATMLTQFLNGLLDRNRMWEVLRQQQRYRQPRPSRASAGGLGG